MLTLIVYMATINIQVDTTRVQDLLTRLAALTSDAAFGGAMAAIGERLVVTTRQRIDAGLKPDGNPFQPLSDVTLSIRRSKGRHGVKPVIDTGTLRGGIHYLVGDRSVSINANRQGAFAVQLGARGAGRGRKVTIPARPFLGVSESDWTDIDRILTTIINNVTGNSG